MSPSPPRTPSSPTPQQPPQDSSSNTAPAKDGSSAAVYGEAEISNTCPTLGNFYEFFFSLSLSSHASYSIMSLSPGGCVINGMKFSSCQLYWRHWTIRANDAVVSNVNGEAVIGKPIMESTYGKDSAVKWTVYWRTFFIAVAELFGYNDGEEWMVSLFPKK